jgi:hypothetical protein
MTRLEAEFEEDMHYICREAKKIGYNPRIFAAMIGELGGVATAKKLVIQHDPTDGYYTLYKKKRLDLTAEAFVIKDKYKELFTGEEITQSYNRLKEYNYTFE